MKRQEYDKEIAYRGTGYYEVKCVQCGATFTSKRVDASFCSATCRSRHLRAKHKKVDMKAWIDERLEHCAKKETELLGNTAIKGWQTELNYWLGQRDLLWVLQKLTESE